MPTATKRSPTTARPTAVICDDDPMSRELMAAALADTGYDVVARVDNAVAAIQAVSATQPDVVLLDLVLPTMAGEEAIPAIKAAAPECTIVIWTAFDCTAAIRQGATIIAHKGAIDQLRTVLNRVRPRARRSLLPRRFSR